MTVSLLEFIGQLSQYPALLVTTVLTLGVILVNGWTDAPNAVATCVGTRSLSPGKAIAMAAVFNFLGVFTMTLINASVVQTIYNMADFGGDSKSALIALCASMVAIVIWATAAWIFGIPTSEGHALIAGVSGAAIALQGGLSGINSSEWMKIIYGLFISTIMGFSFGFGATRIVESIFRGIDKRRATPLFKNAQIGGAAAMAFMHGAQDGQKFMGIFMLGIFLAKGEAGVTDFVIPIWLMVLCSVVMALGTSIGGYRIIKTVGINMVKLEPHQGFSADMAAAGSLLFSSLWGLPVSTTHTKTTAIMGVGVSKRASSVNWNIAKEMAVAWILTFPGCGIVGYAMAYFFLSVFN